MNRRWYRSRPVVQKVAGANGEVYDSQSEAEFHAKFPSFSHHSETIDYISKHTYHPDFILPTISGKIIIEIKGMFETSAEARKYKDVREVLKEGEELVFVFDKIDAKLPWAKKRRDNTYMTYREWATRNGFRSYGPDCTLEDLLGDHKCTG